MKRGTLRILMLFETPGPPSPDIDYTALFEDDDFDVEWGVRETLQWLGHEVRLMGIYPGHDVHPLLTELETHRPDIVFNLTEGVYEVPRYERNVAGLLELLKIPYTGTRAPGLMICSDKALSKRLLAPHRIRVPAFAVFPRGRVVRRPRRLSFPLFVKPLGEEGSVGITERSFVSNDEELADRVLEVHRAHDHDAIAEEYIDGRELYVGVLGNRRLLVFPPREMTFTKMPDDEPRFASFRAKWDMPYREQWGIKNHFARGISDAVRRRIDRTCRRAYRVLGLSGYGRFDIRLTAEGEPYIIEANPNPNLAEYEDFAESAAKSGIKYAPLLQRILRLGFDASSTA